MRCVFGGVCAVALVLACVHVVAGEVPAHTYGGDVSVLYSEETLRCWLQHNLTFVVARAYRSIGAVDPDGVATIANAHAVGMTAEAYMFPQSSAGNPGGQVDAMVAALRKNERMPSRIWLDIEGPGVYWSSDLVANANFIQGLIDALESASGGDFAIGIYTSESQWTGIVPQGSMVGNGYPIWYAAYNGNPVFAGSWSPFAVWKTPFRHQYTGNGQQCGGNYDANWQPPGAPSTTTATTATTTHTTAASSSGISGTITSGMSGTISYGGVSTGSEE